MNTQPTDYPAFSPYLSVQGADQFYGFRSGSVSDPFGHQWMLQHETEKVSPEEMQKRWDAMSGECSGTADK